MISLSIPLLIYISGKQKSYTLHFKFLKYFLFLTAIKVSLNDFFVTHHCS